MDIDHYNVLGLPSGEEGANLTQKEITKAYREKARDLHPDKRKDDPNAHENFIKLKSSYEILVDEKARKLFDDLLRVKREQQRRFAQQDSKRRKMMSDLEDRERASFAPDPAMKAKEEEERIARKLKEEIARIRAMQANKGASMGTGSGQEKVGREGNSGVGGHVGVDKERVLKVSWEKIGEGYTAEKLRELFSRFGEVEDIVVNSSKKKGSALVVMATKHAVDSATGSVSGNLDNPLLVVPLKPSVAEFPAPKKEEQSDRLSNLVGAGYQAFEDAVLNKLTKDETKGYVKQPWDMGLILSVSLLPHAWSNEGKVGISMMGGSGCSFWGWVVG
ncbi:DnaJ subfamily C member 17 [Gossypium arboreum]|uniref:DnaJ subfamily C member 17 n=1 Tax=Gossypium arboreum TaxID=29729 RepID=A0A0B0NY16_GOSAR|nr:DnaJ subfamily C member 17 [Gossypium arboreum]